MQQNQGVGELATAMSKMCCHNPCKLLKLGQLANGKTPYKDKDSLPIVVFILSGGGKPGGGSGLLSAPNGDALNAN
jgi:hypothetical protein